MLCVCIFGQVFGILANLTTLDLPSTSSWSKLLRDYNLLSLLSKILVPGMAQADLQVRRALALSLLSPSPLPQLRRRPPAATPPTYLSTAILLRPACCLFQ